MDSTRDALVLVHLSDIHFRDPRRGTTGILDADLRRELQSDALRVVAVAGRAEGILVGGDIAHSGRKEEYEIAREWLNSFCGRLGCETDDVWVVPGNHDVDRSVLEGSTQSAGHARAAPPSRLTAG